MKSPLMLASKAAVMFALAMTMLVLSPIHHTALGQNSGQEVPPVDLKELLGELQSGGYVLIIRHERTELPSRPDDYSRDPGDCRAQRNLSLAGVAGAQETGFVMRMLDINIGRVITSPMCRSAETARYMFGVNYETDNRLMHHDPEGQRNLDIAASEVRELLVELSPGMPDTNIALITHGGSILRATGLSLSEGEIGVLTLGEDGTINAVGHFMGSDLSPYARRLMQETQ
ncbi:MAG: hypothetical protein WBA51_09555 [Erythrobacter sp.]